MSTGFQWRAARVTLVILAFAVVGDRLAADWPANLVLNPDFSTGASGWQLYGNSRVEGTGETAHAAVNNAGRVDQFIEVPPGPPGRFVWVQGRGSSNRVNSDGALDGLARLGVTLLSPDRTRVISSSTNPSLTAREGKEGRWATMSIILPVLEGTGWLRVSLQQDDRSRLPQPPSTAQFDDVSVQLFATEREARGVASLLRPPLRRVSEDVTPVIGGPAVAFDPEKGVIFGEDRLFDLLPPCSRPWPSPVQGTWPADAASVRALEEVLPPMLQRAFDRVSPGVWHVGDYYRQYLGVLVGGHKILYVNAFLDLGRFGRPMPDWRTTVTRVCDGGPIAFGADFDIESGRVTGLYLNWR